MRRRRYGFAGFEIIDQGPEADPSRRFLVGIIWGAGRLPGFATFSEAKEYGEKTRDEIARRVAADRMLEEA